MSHKPACWLSSLASLLSRRRQTKLKLSDFRQHKTHSKLLGWPLSAQRLWRQTELKHARAQSTHALSLRLAIAAHQHVDYSVRTYIQQVPACPPLYQHDGYYGSALCQGHPHGHIQHLMCWHVGYYVEISHAWPSNLCLSHTGSMSDTGSYTLAWLHQLELKHGPKPACWLALHASLLWRRRQTKLKPFPLQHSRRQTKLKHSAHIRRPLYLHVGYHGHITHVGYYRHTSPSFADTLAWLLQPELKHQKTMHQHVGTTLSADLHSSHGSHQHVGYRHSAEIRRHSLVLMAERSTQEACKARLPIPSSSQQQFLCLILLAGLFDHGKSWVGFSAFLPPGPFFLGAPNGPARTLALLSPLPASSTPKTHPQQHKEVRREKRPLAQPGRSARRRRHAPPQAQPARRSAFAQRTPPGLRAAHPLRGIRIGEAAVPGPPSGSVPQTDTPGDTPPPMPASDNIPLHDTILRIRLATDKYGTLQCKWMQRTASWRWWVGSGDNRLQHQGRGTPATILREWVRMYEAEVLQEGLDEITTVLAMHPDLPAAPPGEAPPADMRDSRAEPLPATPAINHLPATPVPQRYSASPSQLTVPAGNCLPDLRDDFSRCRGCHFWLGKPLRTQRTLPASTLQIVDSVCAAILERLKDGQLSVESRRVFLAMAICLPRWLWPEPPKAPGTVLAPRSRPRLVQAQAQMFQDGDISGLLAALQPDDGPQPQQHTPARTPGHLTHADCHRLLQAGKQGRLTTAWKQLFSYGVAGSNANTEQMLKDKWLPAPPFPVPLQGHHASPAVAHEVLTEDAIRAASRKLNKGSAIDALGWSHEAWIMVYNQPHGRQLLQELLLLYCTGGLGHEGEDLLNASLVIPLYKDARGSSVRPIAVPSVHRKILAKVTVAAFRPELQRAAGAAQHAAMTSNGTLRMAQQVQRHLHQADSNAVYIRTDIRNAFNEVSRQAALDALGRAHPTLGAIHHSWLHRPTTAVMHAQEGTRHMLSTHAGIPQGDPISSLAFGLVLADPLQRLQELPHCTPVAYADDTVIACPPEVALEYLQAWRDSLAAVGLSLNWSKLHVWSPRRLDLPLAFQEAFPDATYTSDGFKVCGLPLDQADATDPHDFAPLGTGEYTQAFLSEAREALLLRLRTLSTFVHTLGPHAEGLQVALSVARVNLQNRHVHLWRFCDRPTMHTWSAQLAADTQAWLSELLAMPLVTPQALIALRVPTSLGGLGFLHPQHEAALHYLQAMLPTVEETTSSRDGDDPVHVHMAECFEYLEHQAGKPLRPLIEHLAPHRMGHRLRSEFYEAIRLQMLDLCPWLEPPPLPQAGSTEPEIPYRWQIRAVLAWYLPTSRHLLTDAPFRFAIQKHLGLPIFEGGQRCAYTPLATGRRCHHALGAYSDHVFTCAQGPGLRRHNRLRDVWVRLCRQAGWHTDPEQLVYVASGETKRADFVTLSPEGQRYACDVMVTATPSPWLAHAGHLSTSAAAKASRYNCQPGGFTHDNARLIPLIHDAHNHWISTHGLRLLHRLVTVQARQTAPTSPQAWNYHFLLTTAEATSDLMCEAVVSAWRMHAASGRML